MDRMGSVIEDNRQYIQTKDLLKGTDMLQFSPSKLKFEKEESKHPFLQSEINKESHGTLNDLNKALIVKMSDLIDTTSQKLPTFPDEVNSPFSNHNKEGNFF